jgi:hypothetical protein
MSTKIDMAYRSPLGRVQTYSFCGGTRKETYEPGEEADRAWERLSEKPPAVYRDGAAWLDGEERREETTMEEEKARKKRERPGTWTPMTLRVPIPGTDNTTDIEMWHVEYDGQAIDVQRTRDGNRTVTDWVRRIQKNKSACLTLDRVARTVEEIVDDPSLSEDVRARARAVYDVLCPPVVE